MRRCDLVDVGAFLAILGITDIRGMGIPHGAVAIWDWLTLPICMLSIVFLAFGHRRAVMDPPRLDWWHEFTTKYRSWLLVFSLACLAIKAVEFSCVYALCLRYGRLLH